MTAYCYFINLFSNWFSPTDQIFFMFAVHQCVFAYDLCFVFKSNRFCIWIFDSTCICISYLYLSLEKVVKGWQSRCGALAGARSTRFCRQQRTTLEFHLSDKTVSLLKLVLYLYIWFGLYLSRSTRFCRQKRTTLKLRLSDKTVSFTQIGFVFVYLIRRVFSLY